MTNSVVHSGQAIGTPVRISAAAVDGVVRVDVENRGPGDVRLRVPGADGGLGLNLVEQVSARWGVSHEHSTLVWFELTVATP